MQPVEVAAPFILNNSEFQISFGGLWQFADTSYNTKLRAPKIVSEIHTVAKLVVKKQCR